MECAIAGSTDPASLSREKVKRILTKKADLAARIQACCRRGEGNRLTWEPEESRAQNVVLKLARGHAAFELSLPQLEDPDELRMVPLVVISEIDREAFERAGSGELRSWPEIGSRAFRASADKQYLDECGP